LGQLCACAVALIEKAKTVQTELTTHRIRHLDL
jgi:hypothetical protein